MSSSIRAFLCVLVVAGFVRPAAAADLRSGTLELDPSKTRIEFRLPGSLHTTHGTFKLEHGIIKADPATGEAAGSIAIDANSGDSGMGARDNRMKDIVLEVQEYPEITFTPGRVTGQLGADGEFQAKLQGVLTLHGAGHQIVVEAQGRLIGDDLVATSHFSVPYVQWGLKDPSLLLLTVAKQVDIDIAAAGHVVWTRERDRASSK